MLAAAEVARYELPGLPIISGLGTVDDLGREWLLVGEKGWLEGAEARTNRTERSDADGSFRSASYGAELIFSVRGSVNVGARPDLLERTRLDISAACAPGGGLHTIRRTAGGFDHTRAAERDGALELEYVGRYDIDFQFTFAAPDPRAHDRYWQAPWGSPPQSGAGDGLDYFGAGLDYSGGGLDYGVSAGADPLLAQVANYGTASAAPLFELRGVQPSPSVVRHETGETVRYLGDVEAGEVVWINCDLFPAALPGRPLIPGRTAVSSRRGDVSSLLAIDVRWPTVAAQDVANFRLPGSGPPECLTAGLRSAWK